MYLPDNEHRSQGGNYTKYINIFAGRKGLEICDIVWDYFFPTREVFKKVRDHVFIPIPDIDAFRWGRTSPLENVFPCRRTSQDWHSADWNFPQPFHQVSSPVHAMPFAHRTPMCIVVGMAEGTGPSCVSFTTGTEATYILVATWTFASLHLGR